MKTVSVKIRACPISLLDLCMGVSALSAAETGMWAEAARNLLEGEFHNPRERFEPGHKPDY